MIIRCTRYSIDKGCINCHCLCIDQVTVRKDSPTLFYHKYLDHFKDVVPRIVTPCAKKARGIWAIACSVAEIDTGAWSIAIEHSTFVVFGLHECWYGCHVDRLLLSSSETWREKSRHTYVWVFLNCSNAIISAKVQRIQLLRQTRLPSLIILIGCIICRVSQGT
jgi:hypothetical protein